MPPLQKRIPLFFGFSAALLLAACGSEAPVEAPRTEPGAIAEGELAVPVMGEEVRILAFGDSLFAGYNLAEPEGYPERLEAALRGRGINARVIDAGVSGDTSAAGRDRLQFVLDGQGEKPDLFILELGGNDLLRGLSPDETRANFDAMLTTLREREIPVLLMGMRAPPNYGPEYQAQFDAMYRELAQQYDTALIPFWLEDIYEDQSLFQNDRIHPTAEGIEALVASTVDEVQAALPEDAGEG
ncbi:arylesterase [Erythrobacter sp. KY5]|uniref:arylesterase n=1 Tax=Erythrobacter sp. KY5 TaxID=2011159 RepID=UPI000DBF3483|nr:arylesterase [Erythrobacter sp. KY5]AWW75341.1 arylesterase [Erythrobacter sp. KY5]